MKTKRGRISFFFSLILPAVLALLYLGSGTGASGIAGAQDVSGTNADMDEVLKDMPESMPKDYSDDEINRMIEDVEQIDDSKDVEGKEEIEAPSVSDEDRALIDDIRENPEKYAEYIKNREWLDAHPVVIWSICSDYVWIDAHPQFAARIYLDYDFWSQYPYVAYIIVRNHPFLVRYPRISLVVYGYDGWFIRHPFIAREVYRNYIMFNRHPDLFRRYYRHREWLHRHPGVIKIACGNRELFKSHTGYLGDIYRYRREAIRKHEIHPRHMEKIYTRWKSDPRHNKTFRPSGPNKEWKIRTDQPRNKNLNRGDRGKSDKLIKRGEQYKPDREYKRNDGRTINTDKNRGGRDKSDKLIKRGEQYNPDREYKRGDGRAINTDKNRDNRGKSDQLIKRGTEYKPDKEYKRGLVPSPDKKIIRGTEGGRSDGRQGGGKEFRDGGSQQGEQGKGDEKRK
jgi:hypothetical protein